jgi:hypothetical protein
VLIAITRRQLAIGVLGVLGAVAMFASGVLVARATMSSDDSSTPASPSPADGNTGGASGRLPSSLPAAGRDVAVTTAEQAGAADRSLYYGGCDAPLGDVFEGSAIDPAKLGFELRTPGDGFTLTSINVRRLGECDETGTATDGDVVVDTRWQHDETGMIAWLAQRVEPDRTSNVLVQGSAEFWDGGYAFSAGVNAYYAMPIDTMATEDAARDSVGGTASAAGSGTTASSPVAPGEPDPRAQEVLETIIARVAPDVGLQCFYRQSLGGWGDLAARGLGDPRGATPSGYSESYVNSMLLNEPAADCGTPAPEYALQFSLDGGFASADGTGYLNVGVYALPTDSPPQAGRLEQGTLSWNTGSYQLYVSGQEGSSAQSDAVLTAIARALDPGFDGRCLVTASSISGDELAALGVSSPLVPEGFRSESAWFQRHAVSGDCSGVADVTGDGFRATWTMFSQQIPAIIELTISKGTDTFASGEPNTTTPYGYYWIDAGGTNYVLNGYKGEVPEETLVAVAKSVDPSFDLSKLTPSGDTAVPLPKPVR